MKLAEWIGIVGDSRGRTSGVFPLPDTPGCVDYAICEAAETIDAILRDKRAGDKRNNDKQPDARREWGQCGYMIASGIMQTDYELHGIGFPNGTIYDVLHYLAQEALDMDGSLVEAFQEWAAYCKYEEWDVEKLLRETCADFERKHLQLPLLEVPA